MAETSIQAAIAPGTAPRIEYAPLAAVGALPADALAAFSFGHAAPDADLRWIHVGLRPLWGEPVAEIWRAGEPVRTLVDGPLRATAGGGWLAGCIELDEAAHGGLEAAAETAYRLLGAFQRTRAERHVLRLWNYLDAINEGEGDAERYRRFCAGRGAGLDGADAALPLPAATAIGRRDGVRRLQVYWLAAREPGVALENPRQVSAWRYPRQYGPVPPRFSRAMRIGEALLLVSGTASVVGHATRHAGDFAAQFDETLENLATVLQVAGAAPRLPGGLLLKAYVRDPADAPRLRELLRLRLPRVPCLALDAEVCRRDLLLELDCLVRLD